MKILFKNQGYGGGAPRSLLEYAKLARNLGHEVFSVGQYTYIPTFYHEMDITTYNIPYFKISSPLNNFQAFFKYLKIINKERPDLIHVTTAWECIFHRPISVLLNIPVVYTLPGGKVDEYFAILMRDEPLIVFSSENRKDLINYNYNIENITLISNRMTFPSIDACNMNVYEARKEKLRFLYIGRLDPNYNSILSVIDLIEKLYLKNHKIQLVVLGEGKTKCKLIEVGEKLNDLAKERVVIFEGYKENVTDYINQAHLVFGKGRSIIDAVSYLRCSFVVGENGLFFNVNEESIERLSEYNFAGRQPDSGDTLGFIESVVISIENKKLNLDEIKNTRTELEKYYSINYAKNKINSLYKSTLNNHFKKSNPKYYRPFKFIKMIMHIYIIFLGRYLLKKLMKLEIINKFI